MKTIITSLALLISTFIIAQNPKAQIDAIINSEIVKTDPGIMVGVVKDGTIIYENYRGLANIEHQVPISYKTRSNIASTAKQFTALMILQLSLDGKLSLEDDIRKHLPNLYKNVKETIKIRHLINHTSGIRDYVELMDLEGDVWWKRVGLDNDDVMALIEKQEDLGFAPGSKYSYSNSGYVVLAELIASVTQQKFTDYSTQFFKDLGMNSTNFIRRYMQVIPNRADPYSDWGYGELFHSVSVTKTSGEGFLYTTLKDQLIYEQTLQKATKNNNELLITSQKAIPNSRIKTYGFGLKLNDQLGQTAVHHDGVTNAYNAQALRFPEEKLSIFIMSNNGNIRSDIIAQKIASVFVSKIENPEKYDAKFKERTTNAKVLKIEGQYNYPNDDKLVRIVNQDGKTFWKEGNYYNLEILPEDKNTFAFANNPKLKIVFYKNKMVEYYPSGKTMTYKRSLVKLASSKDLKSLEGKYTNSELDLSFTLKKNNNTLLFSFLNKKNKPKTVKVLNKNRLLVSNYILKIERNTSLEISEIRLDYNRAKNIRFKKKT